MEVLNQGRFIFNLGLLDAHCVQEVEINNKKVCATYIVSETFLRRYFEFLSAPREITFVKLDFLNQTGGIVQSISFHMARDFEFEPLKFNYNTTAPFKIKIYFTFDILVFHDKPLEHEDKAPETKVYIAKTSDYDRVSSFDKMPSFHSRNDNSND
jgi:hypothetical protein